MHSLVEEEAKIHFTIFMARARISNEDKQRLVDAHDRGEDYVDLARQLNIKQGTAWAIISRAHRRDGVVALPRGGPRRMKLDDEIRNTLVQLVEEHPTFTLVQLKTELEILLPNKPLLSISSIARSLTGSLIVLKKMEDAPAERNTDRTKLLRRNYAEWLMQAQVDKEIVYIDEAGLNLWVRRTRGRARRGERAVRVINGRRGRNLTMVFSISNQRGLLNHDLFEGGMTGQRFVNYLQQLSNENANRNIVYIFDNAPSHRQAHNDVDHGGPVLLAGQEVHALPPYSPFLNPVEQAISAFKAMLKRQLEEVRHELLNLQHQERMALLAQLSEQAVVAITPEASRNWYNHTQRKIPACIQLQDIFM